MYVLSCTLRWQQKISFSKWMYNGFDDITEKLIDGFQISTKCPTSRGQTHNQEAAIHTVAFHLERSSFFYLSALMERTQCSASLLVFLTSCTASKPMVLPTGSEATPPKNHL